MDEDDDGRDEDGKDDELLSWANSLDYEEDMLESENERSHFQYGEQRYEKEHDKRGICLFNEFLLSKNFPEFDSGQFTYGMALYYKIRSLID
jgi:hypothetical protein